MLPSQQRIFTESRTEVLRTVLITFYFSLSQLAHLLTNISVYQDRILPQSRFFKLFCILSWNLTSKQ